METGKANTIERKPNTRAVPRFYKIWAKLALVLGHGGANHL